MGNYFYRKDTVIAEPPLQGFSGIVNLKRDHNIHNDKIVNIEGHRGVSGMIHK